MLTEKEINNLLIKRAKLLNKDYNSKEADVIQSQITKAIKKDFIKYPVDFIIETWTRFGACFQVLYDDNGLFGIGEDLYGPVLMGKQRFEGNMSVYVEKHRWKKTIREALKYYLFLEKPKKLSKKEEKSFDKMFKPFDDLEKLDK